MSDKVIHAIKKSIEETNIKVDISESNMDSNLRSLGVDSLNAMSIIINTEKKLNVRLPDEDLANLRTLRDLISSFEKQLKSK
ncbi:MAG: acyl carrier protein [Mycoplasmataceae bacterium]|jgi:acyl carrier protein|nr:acyl carrier protein [Mycoplasmataceae bacterium]